MRRMRLACATVMVLCACGGPRDARSEELTAREHEEEAARQDRAAAEHDARYDPESTTAAEGAASVSAFYGTDLYNPTEGQRALAERHREHADAHRAVAEDLRAYEAGACGHFPVSTRAACPLLLGLTSVDEVDGGVRLRFAEGADVAPIVEHIRCHIAFSAARGIEGIEHCALYVPGARVRADGTEVTLTTDRAEHVAELRRRVNRQAP